MHRRFPTTTSRAFSLVELLVVISIATIILALSVPSVRGLLLQGQVASASTTIAAAADTARRLAKSEAVQVAFPEGARYQGVAMIFAPSGEIRLAVHEPAASDLRNNGVVRSVDFLQDETAADRYAGFTDIERLDYIPLTEGVDVYGIDYVPVARGAAPSNRIFLPRPFAVRFNGDGRLVVSSVESWDAPGPLQAAPFFELDPRDTRERLVVYDNAYNRGLGYEPPGASNKNTRGGVPEPTPPNLADGWFDPRSPNYAFDPTTGNYAPDRWQASYNAAAERHDLPFSVLEAVGAIRIVQEGEDPNDPESAHTDIVLSRYSGSPAKIQSLR